MIATSDLISKAYRAEQVRLHAQPQGYGGKGKKWAATVRALAAARDCTSVLDYGCGQGSLAVALEGSGLSCREYDPAIPGKDGPPSFADLVVCTDVLEHVEREYLPTVLAHLRGLARKVVLLVVALDLSNKTLTDGRNAHLILESAEWWADQVASAGFTFTPADLPLPVAYGDPTKRSKRWIAVVAP